MNTCVFLELRTNPNTGSAYFIVGEDSANTTIQTGSVTFANDGEVIEGVSFLGKSRLPSKRGILNIYEKDAKGNDVKCGASHPKTLSLLKMVEDGLLVAGKTTMNGVRFTKQNVVHPTTKQVYDNLFWAEYV